jgi:hypothetical protein
MIKSKKKKESHCGFRNGNLFCYNCGNSFILNTPISISMMSAIIKQFVKDHKNCPKTWTEPVPSPEGKTEEQNCKWWIDNGEHGTSSITMLNYLSDSHYKLKLDYLPCHPCDPDDFRRCYLLLKAVPQFRSKLHRMCTVSPIWDKLVKNWGLLEQLLEEQMATGKTNSMYETMKKLGA